MPKRSLFGKLERYFIFLALICCTIKDDEIYEDPWLKLNELYSINALIDEFLDKIWKLATVKNRKADKKINIDKYLEIDKYVDEYTDITDGKIDYLIILVQHLLKQQSKFRTKHILLMIWNKRKILILKH